MNYTICISADVGNWDLIAINVTQTGEMYMYDKVGFGKRLRALRESYNKTQSEVAEEIGISIDTIRKLEQGKRSPSVIVVDLLSDYYNISADYIISGATKQNAGVEDVFMSVPKEKREIIERIIGDIRELIE